MFKGQGHRSVIEVTGEKRPVQLLGWSSVAEKQTRDGNYKCVTASRKFSKPNRYTLCWMLLLQIGHCSFS